MMDPMSISRLHSSSTFLIKNTLKNILKLNSKISYRARRKVGSWKAFLSLDGKVWKNFLINYLVKFVRVSFRVGWESFVRENLTDCRAEIAK